MCICPWLNHLELGPFQKQLEKTWKSIKEPKEGMKTEHDDAAGIECDVDSDGFGALFLPAIPASARLVLDQYSCQTNHGDADKAAVLFPPTSSGLPT